MQVELKPKDGLVPQKQNTDYIPEREPPFPKG